MFICGSRGSRKWTVLPEPKTYKTYDEIPGVLNKCLYGEAPPEVQPLTLLHTIFHEKGAPFVNLLLTNGTPLTYLV